MRTNLPNRSEYIGGAAEAFLPSRPRDSIHAILEGLNGNYPDLCPAHCSGFSSGPPTWLQVHSVEHLRRCEEPLLLDLNEQNIITESTTQLTIRACSCANGSSFRQTKAPYKAAPDLGISPDNKCGAKSKQLIVTTQPAQPGATTLLLGAPIAASDVFLAVYQLSSYLKNGARCGTTIMFALSRDVVIGLYARACEYS
ncbi:hypothetical protein N0V88_001551 [Collariella sp. IMI 366227]|nr:hypothetical protein N0V88_001551 [Collariella sp. IMI 366227]